MTLYTTLTTHHINPRHPIENGFGFRSTTEVKFLGYGPILLSEDFIPRAENDNPEGGEGEAA